MKKIVILNYLYGIANVATLEKDTDVESWLEEQGFQFDEIHWMVVDACNVPVYGVGKDLLEDNNPINYL